MNVVDGGPTSLCTSGGEDLLRTLGYTNGLSFPDQGACSPGGAEKGRMHFTHNLSI